MHAQRNTHSKALRAGLTGKPREGFLKPGQGNVDLFFQALPYAQRERRSPLRVLQGPTRDGTRGDRM